MTMPTRDDIIAIIADEARIDVEKLHPSATLASLGIASLDVISVLFAIEDRFGIEIAAEEVASAETLAQFTDKILAAVATA